MSEIPFSSLAKGAWFRVYWGFLWRSLVITLGSMVAGGLAGGIVGFFLGLVAAMMQLELNQALAQVVGGIIGAGIGLYFYAIYLRWLFRAKFGNLRLALVAETEGSGGVVDAQPVVAADA